MECERNRKEMEVEGEGEGEGEALGPRELARMNLYLDELLHGLNEMLGELRSINHPNCIR